jgi:hypothetical protein
MNIIAFDSHKRYTFARIENENGKTFKNSGSSTDAAISPVFSLDRFPPGEVAQYEA